MTQFFGIIFAQSNNLYLGLFFLLTCGFIFYWVYRSQKSFRVLMRVSRATSQQLFSLTRISLRAVLIIISCAALFIATLRPQWGVQQEVVAQEGRDLFVVLDVSRSMLAVDCEPNRLAVAKKKIRALLSSLSCERVGLILFSGSAFVQCPLTSDYAAFYMFLDHIDVETISSGTTALDGAIKKTIEAFDATVDRKKKLVFIVTDGEDFSADLQGIESEVKRMGLHIFTLGIGTTEGAPIPLFDDRGKNIGHQKDKNGTVVISRLNEELLARLAEHSGGTYIKMTADNADMKQMAYLVSRYEKERLEDKKIAKHEERYHYFLAASFVCAAVEWLL